MEGIQPIFHGYRRIILLFFLSLCRSRIDKVNYRQKEKQVLDSILGHGYDKRIRPSGRNETGRLRPYRTRFPCSSSSSTTTIRDSLSPRSDSSFAERESLSVRNFSPVVEERRRTNGVGSAEALDARALLVVVVVVQDEERERGQNSKSVSSSRVSHSNFVAAPHLFLPPPSWCWIKKELCR